MSEPLPPPSLARAREQKISELSTHFANDDLSLDDLERRIERVYKAASVADLELITADLRTSAQLVEQRSRAFPEDVVTAQRDGRDVHQISVTRARLVAFMSSTRRVGRWAVPRDLRFVAVMSDSKLDLTNAALPVGGVVNIEITAVMASVRIIVPPGMRVINEMHSVMADVSSNADEIAPSSTSPIIRLTGSVIMAEMKVKVRRREEPVFDED
ncbi:MAG TPA: LiaF domain-containing protein [Gemmatimonadaceae bacterium]|jgi:predicted membrane protein